MISNVELWNAIRKINPSFASHTSEGTADLFTERGYSTIVQGGMQTVNEFWQLAMPFYLNLVNISHAEDRLETAGVGEYYDIPWGGYIQRMSVNSIKPLTPAYRNLKNGQSVDPFIVRKPTAGNRFFQYNFDYQSLVTMPEEWENKRIFVSEYGMSEFLAGVFQGLENGYTLQKYLNKLEVINSALNDTTNPLKTTQKISISMSETPTSEELIQFQNSVMNVITEMETSPQSGAFNAMGFETIQDKSRLKLLVRAGYTNALKLNVMLSAFNPENLGLGIDVVEMPHFGGLVPYQDDGFTTRLYPVYNDLGEQIGWNTESDATEVTVENGSEFYKDPNENTYAVLVDKGFIFECRQNPYVVEPIRNPRGLYTNYWASAPNNAILYDPLYTVVTFNTAS